MLKDTLEKEFEELIDEKESGVGLFFKGERFRHVKTRSMAVSWAGKGGARSALRATLESTYTYYRSGSRNPIAEELGRIQQDRSLLTRHGSISDEGYKFILDALFESGLFEIRPLG